MIVKKSEYCLGENKLIDKMFFNYLIKWKKFYLKTFIFNRSFLNFPIKRQSQKILQERRKFAEFTLVRCGSNPTPCRWHRIRIIIRRRPTHVFAQKVSGMARWATVVFVRLSWWNQSVLPRKYRQRTGCGQGRRGRRCGCVWLVFSHYFRRRNGPGHPQYRFQFFISILAPFCNQKQYRFYQKFNEDDFFKFLLWLSTLFRKKRQWKNRDFHLTNLFLWE